MFLSLYPNNGAPSQRFRFEHQLTYLKNSFDVVQLSFWSNNAAEILYHKGRTFRKFISFIWGFVKRIFHLLKCLSADAIFIHREVTPLGIYPIEWLLKKVFRKKIVFDFDDAIWLKDTSKENEFIKTFKSSRKTEKLIQLANEVIAGNKYLANYALQFNKNVSIIPTTIDTRFHEPKNKLESTKICIGWTGSKTTVKHFKSIVPVLKKIKEKYPDKVYFKLIGDPSYSNKDLNLNGVAWEQISEIEDLSELDIGIMPLPEDDWAKGKCGFKGLQYMSLEIPAVMSPVGVNTEIIEDGTNGYLAKNDTEWENKLSLLIESKELRTRLGKKGRETIIERYSLQSQKNKYKEILQRLLAK